MSDSYDAIYAAVCSRIGGCDVGGVVADAARSAFDISWQKDAVSSQLIEYADFVRIELCRPSAVFKPVLSRDGNMWCALLGETIHDGLAAFGESPDAAMREFDRKFTEKIGDES